MRPSRSVLIVVVLAAFIGGCEGTAPIASTAVTDPIPATPTAAAQTPYPSQGSNPELVDHVNISVNQLLGFSSIDNIDAWVDDEIDWLTDHPDAAAQASDYTDVVDGSFETIVNDGDRAKVVAAIATAAKGVDGVKLTTDAATVRATPRPTATPKPKPVSYAKLSKRAWQKVVKAPDKYEGKRYVVWACITQFDAATGTDTFRADATYKKVGKYDWYEGANTLFSGDEGRLEDFVEDDIVVMNVVSLGSYSYDTQIGGNTTVPLFEVKNIHRKGSCAI